MIDIQANVRKLVEEAQKEGINLDIIGEYLKFTKIPKDNDKEIMDRLYREHNVMPWDLTFFRDTDLIIEELKNNNSNEVENIEEIEVVQEETEEIIVDNNEENALIVKEEIGIFTRIASFFSKILEGIKLFGKEESEEN